MGESAKLNESTISAFEELIDEAKESTIKNVDKPSIFSAASKTFQQMASKASGAFDTMKAKLSFDDLNYKNFTLKGNVNTRSGKKESNPLQFQEGDDNKNINVAFTWLSKVTKQLIQKINEHVELI